MSRLSRVAAPVVVCACVAAGAISAVAQTKIYALPTAATEGTSVVSNLPDFMIVVDEGGTLPSDPAATCDNKADGNSKSTGGFHLEHYFTPAKVVFDQKVTVLRDHMPLRQAAQAESGDAKVVTESVDGLEAAYAVVTQTCVGDARPSATRIDYYARMIRGTTYADITVRLYAPDPGKARAYASEMARKIGALNYASVK
jgi:hypothetical protein